MQEDRRTGGTRFKVGLTVKGRIPATPINATMLDISSNGCLISTPDFEAIAKDATILLDTSSLLQLSGEAAWSDHTRCGISFHRELDEDDLGLIRRESVLQREMQSPLRDNFGRESPNLPKEQ